MRRLMIATTSLLLTSCALAADEPGFKQLFNGTDLTGWSYGGVKMDGLAATPDNRFIVKDGAVVAVDGKGVKSLVTSTTFEGELTLRLQFRAGLKADSGVYVRGPQLQVRDFIRRKEQMQLERVFRNDDWNDLEIIVRNDMSTTIVNGVKLGETDRMTLIYRDGILAANVNGKLIDIKQITVNNGLGAVCKINGVEFDPGYAPGAKGTIGIQAEVGQFEFRQIRIKR